MFNDKLPSLKAQASLRAPVTAQRSKQQTRHLVLVLGPAAGPLRVGNRRTGRCSSRRWWLTKNWRLTAMFLGSIPRLLRYHRVKKNRRPCRLHLSMSMRGGGLHIRRRYTATYFTLFTPVASLISPSGVASSVPAPAAPAEHPRDDCEASSAGQTRSGPGVAIVAALSPEFDPRQRPPFLYLF